MKHPIGAKVKVVKATDDTFDERFMNKEGTVISHNSNGMTGNTEEDPMHVVKFESDLTGGTEPFTKEDFWYEELQLLN